MRSEELSEMLHVLEARIAEIRRLNELDVPEPIYRSIIGQLKEVGDFATKAATAIAVAAVREGALSKRAAADKLHIHPHTLDKWAERFEQHYRRYLGWSNKEDHKTTPLDTEVLDAMQ